MNQFAEVALPVAVDKTFTYLVPPDFQHLAAPGVRVIVPFGRKYSTGLIVHMSASSSIKGIKLIHDIIDARPVVSEELLKLCRWIAEYYFAPLGEVLKAALPHGFAASKRMVRTSLSLADLNRTIKEMKSQAPKRAKLLQFLIDNGPTPSAELKKKVGLKNITAVLNDMELAGLVVTEEMIPHPQQKAKLKEYILVESVNSALLEATLRDISPRRKKARQLLTSLQWLKEQRSSEVALSDLLKKSGATSATLKEFVGSGLVPIMKREVNRAQDFGTEEQTLHITLNDNQKNILQSLVAAVDAGVTMTFLLHGVTGSGKTQVYIEAIRHCLSQGKTVIVLVPEISLTPQIVRRFKSHFADRVAVVHSRMSAGERYDVWRLALRGTYKIVIGPRSAVFAPLSNLGLIVVDEEHEGSYKQFDSSPRYNARDVAIVRGTHSNAVVVLGSATPSAESYHNAMNGKYTLLSMPQRIDQVPMPVIEIVDMTQERKRAYAALRDSIPEDQRKKLRDFKQSSISDVLKRKIEDRLKKKEGIILLQNRRGFAPFVECPDCGYSETCENCSITLTYHLAKKHLRCHYCGMVRQPHAQCPQCKGVNIQLHGIGTQRVEEELATLFPNARVLRMDLDTTSRKGAHDRILRKFGDGEVDILLGTQMVAKGLDFPRVTLVGVISADTQMLLPDFRSSERTFQLLTQVAGRAGRSDLLGEVIIQTQQTGHYTLQHVVDHDVKKFFEEEMEERKELEYPPFSRLALVEMKGPNEPEVQKHSERFARLLKVSNGTLTILGPAPAVIAKINNQYRWHIIIKSPKTSDPSGAHLRTALRKAVIEYEQSAKSSVRLTIDVDPVGLM
jgi:primosomal protein N' (replication factor Y)